MEGISVERVYKVYDDATGEAFHVGADGDGLGLVRFQYIDETGHSGDSILMTREVALEFSKCLAEYIADDRNFIESP